MVSLTRSKAVVELGNRLVSQLDVDDDLLASWMAHYIAQLIEAAEKAPPEAKATAQEACAKAILELWRHRATLPDRFRPLAELEPLLRTLASLDAERTDYRYYPDALSEAETANTDDNTKQWLQVAIVSDRVARFLIQTALRSAARSGASTAQPWVELAAQAGAGEDIEKSIVQIVLPDGEEGEVFRDVRDRVLKRRLSELETVVEFATTLTKDLRAQLGVEEVKKD
jgi:hypothetical protein